MFSLIIKDEKDIATLRESAVLECKLAAGKDGKGQLPKDFWATYSALANTRGGVVLLGVKEIKQGQFELVGVNNAEQVVTDLFNTLDSIEKTSINLLTHDDVQILHLSNKKLIQINVRPATRQEKPVFINGNPLTGTYRRIHDGDKKCTPEVVRRLLAEQSEDSRDTRIMQGYSMQDIDPETLRIYRQYFINFKPDHPWNAVDNEEFLRLAGCWRHDRATGEEGLTLAAILMFGQANAVSDACSLLMFDYQELPEHPDTDTRWLDRVVYDGTWSGNVFGFYLKVAPKLVADLKTPFKLVDGIRQDDTPQHKALREALINTLVHADYSGRASIRIQKSPNSYNFRNPGALRIPAEQVMKGGESDCRNRTLHQLFLMLGLGERAGSGLPKIRAAWEQLGYKLHCMIASNLMTKLF